MLHHSSNPMHMYLGKIPIEHSDFRMNVSRIALLKTMQFFGFCSWKFGSRCIRHSLHIHRESVPLIAESVDIKVHLYCYEIVTV